MMFARSIKFLLLSLLCHDATAFMTVGNLNTSPGTVQQSKPTNLHALAIEVDTKDMESLLNANRKVVDSLASDNNDDISEITLLRFALAYDSLSESKAALRGAVAYRASGNGKSLVDSALDAYETASIGGGWDNEVVRNSAPHAQLINKYISSKNIVTVSTADGDLVYVIRASLIDDKAMMDNVSIEQLSDFFMYVKEIHSLVADARSKRTGRLCEVILANDITGVRKAPDSRFSKALSSSSSQYDKLYPSLAGPTMILNLPLILQAFVALIKPLFPKTVQKKLKFVRAPVLARLPELTALTTSKATNKSFMREIETLLTK